MAYQYRVTLSGIKGFYRVYRMSPQSTLYSFHKQMGADMEFPADQLILFKALGAEGQVIARYGLFDLGDGAADHVTLAQTVRNGVTSFVYFYDVKDKKNVIITFEGEDAAVEESPRLSDSKGPDPIDFENGYVAFEDLPVEERHLPEEKEPEKKKNPLAGLLEALDSLDDEDEDGEDDEDEEEEEEEEDDDEDGKIIYDGSEELPV